MDAEGLLDRLDKSGNDDEDRCKLCGCLLVTETMLPDIGKGYMFVYCNNAECNNYNNKRKVYI